MFFYGSVCNSAFPRQDLSAVDCTDDDG